MQQVTRQIVVSGRVQGVGFRYFAQKNARLHGVNGYVKNLYDGRVEVVAEGESEQVEQFIEVLKQGPVFGRVENVEVTSLPYENRYETFNVAF
jgi:acylphosphatase